jgi:hypothetical protein
MSLLIVFAQFDLLRKPLNDLALNPGQIRTIIWDGGDDVELRATFYVDASQMLPGGEYSLCGTH